jgi:hypothetical protein
LLDLLSIPGTLVWSLSETPGPKGGFPDNGASLRLPCLLVRLASLLGVY